MMSQYLDPATLALEEIRQKSLEKTAQDGTQPQVAPMAPTQSVSPTVEAPTNQTPTSSGWFGAGKSDAMAEAEQNDSDRKSAWDNIKGNKDLPMLGLMFGLNMLANSGTNDLGTALGKAGATTLNAYQTMQKQKADADYKRAHMDLWQQQAAAQKKKAERDAQFEDLKAEAWKRYYNGDRSMDVMATLFPQQYGQYVLNSQLAEDKAALRPVAGSGRSSSGGGRSGGGAPVLGVAHSGQPVVSANGAAPQTDGGPAPAKDDLGGSFGTYYDFSNKSALKGLPTKGTYSFGEPTMVTFPDGSQHWGSLDKSGKIFRSSKQPEGIDPKVTYMKPGESAKKEAMSLVSADNVLKTMDSSTKEEGADDHTGIIFGSLPDWLVNRYDPEGVKLRTQIVNFESQIMNALSGAAVSPTEEKRLKGFLPTTRDDLATLQGKISSYKQWIRDKTKAWEKQYGKNNAFDEILERGKESQASSGGQGASTNGAPPAPNSKYSEMSDDEFMKRKPKR